MGTEEIEVITPVLDALRADGMQLVGPLPADTLFVPHTCSRRRGARHVPRPGSAGAQARQLRRRRQCHPRAAHRPHLRWTTAPPSTWPAPAGRPGQPVAAVELAIAMAGGAAMNTAGASLVAAAAAWAWPPAAQPDPARPPRRGAPQASRRAGPGGGAARGFAHIGVIKALETSGIGARRGGRHQRRFGGRRAVRRRPRAFELQKLAIQLDEASVTDWSLFDRGLIKGEALERFINTNVGGRPIEGLRRRFAAVATDLQSGEPIVFQRGNTGTAVRASSSIPGVFPPVTIGGREYVDGGLVAPIPVPRPAGWGRPGHRRGHLQPPQRQDQGRQPRPAPRHHLHHGRRPSARPSSPPPDVVIRPSCGACPPPISSSATRPSSRREAGFAAIARVRDAIAAWERN